MLAPAVRAEFKSEATNLFGIQRKRYEVLAGEYERLAAGAGIDPMSVVLDPWFGPKAPITQDQAASEFDKLVPQ